MRIRFSLAIVVKLTVSLGMALTFPLQFYVPIQIMWPFISQKFSFLKKPITVELIFRTLVVLIICKCFKFLDLTEIKCLYYALGPYSRNS